MDADYAARFIAIMTLCGFVVFIAWVISYFGPRGE